MWSWWRFEGPLKEDMAISTEPDGDLPEQIFDFSDEAFWRCLGEFKGALHEWHRAVDALDRIATRWDRLADELGGQDQLTKRCAQRLGKLREKRGYPEAPSNTLRRRFERKHMQAEADLRASINKMRGHVVTLSADAKEAKENLDFFDSLAVYPIRNSGPIIAFAEKLLTSKVDSEDTAERTDSGKASGKSLPVPAGFGLRLAAAIRLCGHTKEQACAEMGEMDPKTLRKLLSDGGPVHQSSLNQASTYIKNSRAGRLS
jgi:hypothetical protein